MMILSLNVYNAGLVPSVLEPHTFLLLEAVTPARLHAALFNKNGEQILSRRLTVADLQSKA
ncbi:MAG: hypothetical protein EOP86_11540 [Verrucomicrobiaceae bacterium]|nr:MAG: hypothetical protein EOP86_11540 [Verrucomicrobiaceae bacterium]